MPSFGLLQLLVVCGLVIFPTLGEETSTVKRIETNSTQVPKISDDYIKAVLTNKRYLKAQTDCMLGEGPCDRLGKQIKAIAPQVIRGTGINCSPEEQRQVKMVISYMQRNHPKEWKKILDKFSGL